jgi:hypothetical protein
MTQELAIDATYDSTSTMLKLGIVHVVFTKKDGTERKMNCTLKESMLPEQPVKVTESAKREVSKKTIAVYDLEAKGWRSFALDSVKSIELL